MRKFILLLFLLTACSRPQDLTLGGGSWPLEDYFNSDAYSTGNLNGQNSWTAHTVYQVQSSVVNEGNQAISFISGGSPAATKAVSGGSSGIFYVSIRKTSVAVSQNMLYEVKESGTNIARVKFDAGTIYYFGPSAWNTLATGLSANTWYRVGLEYNCSTDQFRVNLDNGTWTAWTNNAGNYNCTNLTTFGFVGVGGSGTFYADTISGDYTPGGGGSPESTTSASEDEFMLFN